MNPLRAVFLMCSAEVLSMTGFSVYPALLALLQREWGLSNWEAGLAGGAFFGGYMAAVPVLTSLTDRMDARRIYAFSCALSVAGSLGFALLAQGLWGAVIFQAVVGAGLAGTYMPGLAILSDRVGGPRQGRYVAFYTSSFGFGTVGSLLLAGGLETAVHWRWIFGLSALGPVLAAALVLWVFQPHPPHQGQTKSSKLLDFRPVIANREALRYILGYAVHCWELFGLRSWMVAFLAFSATLGGSLAATAVAASAAAFVNLLGAPASILGNEWASRGERWPKVRRLMAGSALIALATGFSAPLPWLLVVALMTVYFVAIMSDSASLTAAVVAAARPGEKGSTLALHSLLGFGAGFLAPLVFGLVLDIAGGNQQIGAWGAAFASLGAPALCFLLLMRARRQAAEP